MVISIDLRGREWRLVACAIGALLCNAAALSAWDGLGPEVERGMELWHVPGMAVAVVDSEKVQFSGGFGSTAIDGGETVDEHTLFAIASTTKAMVVAGVLMLADEGKLSLDDAITAHVPELRFANPALDRELSIRDMLAHRTGLPSTDYWAFLLHMKLSESIPRLQLVDQEAPARARLIYQNTMYELAGLIIERVSGRRWDAFLTERLWHPIGMKETYGARGQIPGSRSHAMPHNRIGDELLQMDWDLPPDMANAAGSVWSSVHDMGLWAQFVLRDGVTADGKRLISEEGMAEMFEPHQLASPDDFYPTIELTQPNWRTYGLGWFQQDFQGRMINFHTGSLGGLIAIIGVDRASDRAIVALGNRDHAEMRHALLWYVMDESSPGEKRDWNREVFDLYEAARLDRITKREEADAGRLKGTNPSMALEFYAGTYTNAMIGDVIVSIVDGELSIGTAAVDFETSHWHLDTFRIGERTYDFRDFCTFNIAASGEVGSLLLFGQLFVRQGDDESGIPER